MMIFVLSYMLFMFCCYLLEACSFLVRDRKRADPDGREMERNWEERGGGGGHNKEKNLFSIKYKKRIYFQ